MRLAYFGTSPFAVPALRTLADSVELVVTQPSRPTGRGNRLLPTPVGQTAAELGIETLAPEKARDPEFVSGIEAREFDAIVVASYGQILSERLLAASRRGGINLHASILPKFRGAAPIARAILEGEPTTGVTLMQMDKGMDTGDMIAGRETPIGPDETCGELEGRLAEIAAGLAAEWLPRIVAGEYPRVPQNHEQATLAAKVMKDEARLDFSMSAEEAYRRFRAFTPRPGAYLPTAHRDLRIHEARLGALTGSPGEVLGLEDGIELAFATGSLRLIRAQPASKKAVSWNDLANGWRLVKGASLSAETFP